MLGKIKIRIFNLWGSIYILWFEPKYLDEHIALLKAKVISDFYHNQKFEVG